MKKLDSMGYINNSLWKSIIWIFAKCNGDNKRENHVFEERIERYSCDNNETLERYIGQCEKCGILEDDEIFYLNMYQ